jgi:hypothetical protein
MSTREQYIYIYIVLLLADGVVFLSAELRFVSAVIIVSVFYVLRKGWPEYAFSFLYKLGHVLQNGLGKLRSSHVRAYEPPCSMINNVINGTLFLFYELSFNE